MRSIWLVVALLSLGAKAFTLSKDALQLPLYENYFVEEFAKDFSVLSHVESTASSHYKIAGKYKNNDHKMHVGLGPDIGVVLRVSKANGSFNGSGAYSHEMPGFAWNVPYNPTDFGMKQSDANIRFHPRKYLSLYNYQIVPYSGLDYTSIHEKIDGADTNRDTKLYFVPIGLSLPVNNMVFQVAVSGMLWGDVQVENHKPEVSDGYGMLLGVLWHSDKVTNCHADWSMRHYNVANDNFSVVSQSEVSNNISAWSLKCDMLLN